MPTRNVGLTDHQTNFVEQLVTSGRYQNASEILREGLRLIERRESEVNLRLAALREAARIGITDIDADAFHSFDSADALGQHLAKLASKIVGSQGVNVGLFAWRLLPRRTAAKFCDDGRELWFDTSAGLCRYPLSVQQALSTGPACISVKECGEIGTNICTLHVARNGHKGRHFFMLRVDRFQGQDVIDMLRLLHDSMDLERHLPPAESN